MCTVDAFPFASIEDDVDYLNTLFIHNFGYRMHWSIINNTEQLDLISRSLKVDKKYGCKYKLFKLVQSVQIYDRI